MSILKAAYLFCFTFTFLCIFTQAECAEWKLFYQVEEGTKYYFDKESVVNPQKGIVQVWLKTTLQKDDSEEAEQYRNHLEINCKSKSYRILEEATPDNVQTEDKNQQPSTGKTTGRLSLESVLGSLWDNLCP